jgi:hypothetical protein
MLFGKPDALVRPRDNVNRRASGNRKRDLRHRLAGRGARQDPENAGQDTPGKAAEKSPEMPLALLLSHSLNSEPLRAAAQFQRSRILLRVLRSRSRAAVVAWTSTTGWWKTLAKLVDERVHNFF